MDPKTSASSRLAAHKGLGLLGAVVLAFTGFSLSSSPVAHAANPIPTGTATGTRIGDPPNHPGGDAVAPANNPCYYTEHYKTWYDLYTFPDKNYMNATFSTWQVPTSGCTQWAGHNFGDSEVETSINLGSAIDQFYPDSANPLSAFGYANNQFGSPPPTDNNTPYATSSSNGCAVKNAGWGGSFCEADWASGTTLTGTDGDTTAYVVSPIGLNGCDLGGNSLLNVSNYAQYSIGGFNYSTGISRIGFGAQGSGIYIFYSVPKIYFDEPGSDCSN